MREWVCTEYLPDGAYSRAVFASSRDDAERIASYEGWALEGELFARVPGDQLDEDGANAIIAALSERDGTMLH